MSILPFSSRGIIIVAESKRSTKKEREADIKRMRKLVNSAFGPSGKKKDKSSNVSC